MIKDFIDCSCVALRMQKSNVSALMGFAFCSRSAWMTGLRLGHRYEKYKKVYFLLLLYGIIKKI